MAQVTAHDALTYSLKREQAQFAEEADRLAKQAAYIAANPPSEGRAVSGDITRLIQEAAFLLKRAATIEAGLEAVGLMDAETATTEK
ncbi:hypothetical protein OH797_38435 (plasmid) [Streptomyces anulatus]|uniref:hypothetical protein n=1 Tax=Streptomyces TaxID=1883 RepID=UPI0006F20153|nr:MULTISPECIES: hypothetical protein [unclassified Streptomyces]KQX44540.1 hypothetical protein ASD29_00625 [Streptomyces sp. Root1295]KRA45432.1 hypothetical protein ASD97_39610 [Streptomyces sp. Root63]